MTSNNPITKPLINKVHPRQSELKDPQLTREDLAKITSREDLYRAIKEKKYPHKES